jgi:hypothetical protein
MPARTLVLSRGPSAQCHTKQEMSLHFTPTQTNSSEWRPLWHLRIEQTESISTASYSHMDITCAVGNVLGIPPEAPSIEQQFLVLYSTVQSSISPRGTGTIPLPARCGVAALHHFQRTGRADWPTLPRPQREKAQPTTSSSTDGSSPLPPTIPKSMARLSHKPHLLTVKRRRVAELPMAEHSACGDT